jgi:hypothetical protein
VWRFCLAGEPLKRNLRVINMEWSLSAISVICALALLSAQPRETKITIDLSALGRAGEHITFTEVNEVKSLPSDVLDKFSDGMANPKADFQETDVVMGKQLPTRRLIVAGVSEKYCLVHYERGGRGHSWLIALFTLSKEKMGLVWVSTLSSKTRLSLRELKSVVESGHLHDQPGHTYW